MSKSKSLLWKNGGLTEIDTPAPFSGVGDVEPLYREAGYRLSQIFGDDAGVHFRLYEADGPRWFIEFNTAGYCVEIFCESWLDLVQCLAYLAPVAVAASFTEEDDGEPAMRVRVVS